MQEGSCLRRAHELPDCGPSVCISGLGLQGNRALRPKTEASNRQKIRKKRLPSEGEESYDVILASDILLACCEVRCKLQGLSVDSCKVL